MKAIKGNTFFVDVQIIPLHIDQCRCQALRGVRGGDFCSSFCKHGLVNALGEVNSVFISVHTTLHCRTNYTYRIQYEGQLQIWPPLIALLTTQCFDGV